MTDSAEQPLTISANTLRFADLDTRIAAAVGAGFTGIGLRLSDYHDARNSGLSDADIAGRIADSGLAVVELEDMWDWVEANAYPRETSDTQEEMFRVAELLGVRQFNLASFFAHPLSEIVESFGRLCDRAGNAGVLVGLEFLPYAQISHLTFAWQVVADANRDNGGVLIDAWHYFRSGSQHDQLSGIPVEKIIGVQINDVLPHEWSDTKNEARHHRQLPGQGSGDLTGLLGTLGRMRYRGPIAVEVFSDALDALPPHVAATECMSSAAALLRASDWTVPDKHIGK